jgi:hypothetical protein
MTIPGPADERVVRMNFSLTLDALGPHPLGEGIISKRLSGHERFDLLVLASDYLG